MNCFGDLLNELFKLFDLFKKMKVCEIYLKWNFINLFLIYCFNLFIYKWFDDWIRLNSNFKKLHSLWFIIKNHIFLLISEKWKNYDTLILIMLVFLIIIFYFRESSIKRKEKKKENHFYFNLHWKLKMIFHSSDENFFMMKWNDFFIISFSGTHR